MTDQSESGSSEQAGSAAGVRGNAEVTQRLLEAACKEFAEHGFASATVAKIARESGMTTGAIYSRWPDKRDLFIASIEYAFENRLLLQFSGGVASPTEIFKALGANLLSPSRHKMRDLWFEAYAAAKRDEAIRETLQRFQTANEEVLTNIIEAGKASGAIDPTWCTEAIVFLCLALGGGTHLLLRLDSSGLFVPGLEEWNRLMGCIMEALRHR